MTSSSKHGVHLWRNIGLSFTAILVLWCGSALPVVAEAASQNQAGARSIVADLCKNTDPSFFRQWKSVSLKRAAPHDIQAQTTLRGFVRPISSASRGAGHRRAADGLTSNSRSLPRGFHELESCAESVWAVKAGKCKLGRHTLLQAETGNAGNVETYLPASPLYCKVVSTQLANLRDSGVEPDSSDSVDAPKIYSIVLDHQRKLFFREGQSVGIIPWPTAPSAVEGAPAVSVDSAVAENGKWQRYGRVSVRPRLYSIASGSRGDDGLGTTFTLCVKKHLYKDPVTGVREPAKDGLCSTYICSVKPGDTVAVTGPVGKALLLPLQDSSPLVMLGTGTGVAPFRSHVAHICAEQQGLQKRHPREVLLFLGSQSAASLPYMAEWQALKARKVKHGIDVHFAWSQPAYGVRKTYVQDVVWAERDKVWDALAHKKGHLYVCGMRDMLVGVESVLNRMAAEKQLVPGSLVRQLKMEQCAYCEVLPPAVKLPVPANTGVLGGLMTWRRISGCDRVNTGLGRSDLLELTAIWTSLSGVKPKISIISASEQSHTMICENVNSYPDACAACCATPAGQTRNGLRQITAVGSTSLTDVQARPLLILQASSFFSQRDLRECQSLL